MSKKGKIYRGQRKHHHPCGCFYCVGTNKQDKNLLEEDRIDKEIKEVINSIIFDKNILK